MQNIEYNIRILIFTYYICIRDSLERILTLPKFTFFALANNRDACYKDINKYKYINT